MEYTNIPKTIGLVISHKMATLTELQTVYSLEDVYNMIEVIMIDNYNERIINKTQGS